MSTNNSFQGEKDHDRQNNVPSGRSGAGIVLRFLLAAVVLGAAGYTAYYWMANKPRSTRKPREAKAALVEVTEIEIADHRITVDAMGTVVPARSMDITSRVSGEIIKVSPEFFPGGHLKKGDLVVEIDKVDYKLLLKEAEFALQKASQALVQSGLNIEQSELAIEQSELAIEQSKLAIKQRKADIVKAEKDLTLEKGQQKIAKREYEVLGEKISEKDEELVLRRPQLKAAEASVESAKARLEEAEAAKKSAEAAKKSTEAQKKSTEAQKKSAESTLNQAKVAVEKAKLNLARTDILAPFNAVIQEKKVEIGSQVSIGAPIVKIVDSNEYWIQVLVPVDRLKWISIPMTIDGEVSSVKVYNETGWGKEAFRAGKVKRLMTEVETKGRMARLLISIDDPLSLQAESADKLPLILGAYVRVEIEGSDLPDVVKVSRTSLHDTDKVWIMRPESDYELHKIPDRMIDTGEKAGLRMLDLPKTLEIRQVNIVWSDKDSVYIKDSLKDGEKLIISDLSTPVEYMAVRLAGEAGAKATGEEKR